MRTTTLEFRLAINDFEYIFVNHTTLFKMAHNVSRRFDVLMKSVCHQLMFKVFFFWFSNVKLTCYLCIAIVFICRRYIRLVLRTFKSERLIVPPEQIEPIWCRVRIWHYWTTWTLALQRPATYINTNPIIYSRVTAIHLIVPGHQ